MTMVSGHTQWSLVFKNFVLNFRITLLTDHCLSQKIRRTVARFQASGSDNEELCTPPELRSTADAATLNLLPAKSKERYEKQYEIFNKWKKSKNVKTITENMVLAYISERAKQINAATLWSEFSMLKTTFEIKNDFDFGKFSKVLAYLKQNSVNYVAKKSKTFSREECITFLHNAPEGSFLMIKVVLIMGLYGACRGIELINMSLEHITDTNNMLVVTVPETKTNLPRRFTITDTLINGMHPISIFKKYIALRPKHTPHKRFFVNDNRGKCTIQPVGKNTMSKIPSKIAAFLKLPNPHLYTGHCLRRTSATLLANSGTDFLSVKRHGGWKSSTVAEGYVGQSLHNKVDIANKILGDHNKSAEQCHVERMVVVAGTSASSNSTIVHPQSADTDNTVLINNNNSSFVHSTSVQLPANSNITINNAPQGTIIINCNSK